MRKLAPILSRSQCIKGLSIYFKICPCTFVILVVHDILWYDVVIRKGSFSCPTRRHCRPTSSRFVFINSSCVWKMTSPFRFITCMRILNVDYHSSPICFAFKFIIHDCEIVNQLSQFNKRISFHYTLYSCGQKWCVDTCGNACYICMNR